MERSDIREPYLCCNAAPDFAALNPGYEARMNGANCQAIANVTEREHARAQFRSPSPRQSRPAR